MDNIKLKISEKILDVVEGLPRFRKGVISSLQDIREHQREWSSKEFTKRDKPTDSSIELSKITLVLTFEHEDFDRVIKGLKRYFPKNERILRFTQSLRDSADKINASSWHNLGYVAREQGVYLPDVSVDENLPPEIKSVSLSFHRILPSLACIIYEFNLDISVSEKLTKIQDKPFLGAVEFKNLWPPSRIHRGYTMGTSSDSAINSMNNAKNSVRDNVESWVKNGFGWKPEAIGFASYIDVYEITGNPEDLDERRSWLKDNRAWLYDYGIDVNGINTLEGDGFLISDPRSSERDYLISDVVCKFESKNKSQFGDFLEYKIRAIAVASTIYNVLEKYRRRIEFLRAHGFKNLYRRKKLTRKNQYNIQEIKRTIVIISRLEHEFNHSRHWVMQSISEVGELTDLIRKEHVDLGKNTVSNFNYQVKNIKEAASIIDSGLTNYLSVQSIYVMYKLQKWMFILSIVVTIATIIGVLSSWNSLKALMSVWLGLEHNKLLHSEKLLAALLIFR